MIAWCHTSVTQTSFKSKEKLGSVVTAPLATVKPLNRFGVKRREKKTNEQTYTFSLYPRAF